jgi:hypothetical protein
MLLVGCASAIKTKKHVKYDLGDYKTFAYLPNTSFSANDFGSISQTSVEESLITALNNNMSIKGYTIDTDSPDLLVLISTSKIINGDKAANPNEESQSSLGGGTSGPNYAAVSSTNYKRYLDNSSTTSSRPYKTGSLLIEIFSRETKELVWSGAAEDFTTHISDQTLTTRLLYEMLKEFPN